MKKYFIKSLAAFFVALFSGFLGQAQECGTISYQEEVLMNESISEEEKEALLSEYHEKLRAKYAKWDASARSNEKGEIYVLPVVFHVFHKYGNENISKAQIKDQIRILNEDFNGQNSSMDQLVEEFRSIIGNTEVEFRLATLDPEGNCTDGINRIYDPKTYYDGRGPIQQHKRDYGWPSNQYLNIYVVGSIETSSNGGTILGYAQFPGGNPATDGFVVRHDNVGSIGTSNPGRATTSTHEVGHMLGLFHTWGNCSSAGSAKNCASTQCDDGVSDTPVTYGHPSTCNLAAETCGSLDNVQNFMDYATCAVNFTAGQATRMRGVLQNDNSRANLHTPANLVATGSDYPTGTSPTTLCEAVIDFNDNRNYCPGEAVSFFDRSFHKITSRTWTFEDADVATSTDADPVVTFNSPGLKTVTLEVTNGTETRSTSQTVYISSEAELGAFPFADDIEAVDISNRDQYEIVDGGGNIAWRVSTTTSNGSGSQSFYIPNVSADEDEGEDEIVSNTIDLSSASEGAKFGFDFAYARRALTNSDQLRLSFSNDCGQTWFNALSMTRNSFSTAPTHTSSFFPSGPEEWKNKIVDIPNEYLTSNFKFRFTFIAAGGNNAFIDNINISQTGVGITETLSAKLGVNVFPNPAADAFEVSLEVSSAVNADVVLMDVIGNTVVQIYSGDLNTGTKTFKVDASKLSSGLYFLRISNPEGSISEKVVLSK